MSEASVLYDVPGPRAKVRDRVTSVVTIAVLVLVLWAVVAKLASKGQLTAAKWHPFLTADLWKKTYVLPGIQGTLTAAALSIVLAGGVLGFALGVGGRMSPNSVVRWPCAVIVEFFRAVPVLIMMIFAYFLFALYDVFPSKQLALAGVVTGLTLYNGAVIAEIVRAGVSSLPRGQSEAASALGLRWGGQTMRAILLPPGGDIDAAGAGVAAGGGAEGHRDRLPDHVFWRWSGRALWWARPTATTFRR